MSYEPSDLAVISYVEPDDSAAKRLIIDMIERASGRGKIEAIYHQLRREDLPIPEFFARGIELGGLQLEVNRVGEERIPRDGPLVLIANHPFGIVDGLLMCDIAARTRGDFKILLNSRLCRDSKMDPLFLPISFEETREATRTNVETKRIAQRVLADNGTIIIFPSGGVATRQKLGFGPLEDLPWSTFVAKIVAQSKATVVPVYFHGENGFLFHFVSAFSQTLRTALLMREVTKRIDGVLKLDIGKPVTWEQMAPISNRKALTRFLYERVFELGDEDPIEPMTATARPSE